MKLQLKALLNNLRLLDESGGLSLSNLALIVVIVKMALSSNLSFADAAVLLPVISNYAVKTWHLRKFSQQMELKKDMITTEFQMLQSDVEKLKLKLGFINR